MSRAISTLITFAGTVGVLVALDALLDWRWDLLIVSTAVVALGVYISLEE